MKLFLRISLLLTLCISVNSFIVLNQNAELKKDEAQKAFEYLNEMRANPAAYSDEVGIKLSAYEKRPALVWNPILAEVAEKKAADMANRNYFSHQTPEGEGINVMIHDAGYELKEKWYSDKSKNYFESIQAGISNGVEVIRNLVLDAHDKKGGHRNHLLGDGDWNKGLVDIGIGMAYSSESKYGTYASIIIAKHDY